MSKSVHELAQVAGQVFESVIDESDVKHVFKVLHGFYGNLLLSKFATGRVVEKGAHKGEDEGIVNARAIWAHALRKHGPETIKVALARCQAADGGPAPDQSAYEPLFRSASDVLAHYRELLGVKSVVGRD